MEIGGAIRRVWPDPASLTTKRWLVLIVLLGALLRFVPITFGLPLDRARPDEEVAIGRALAMVGGDLNPHFFDWGSLSLYLFAVCFSVAAWIPDQCRPERAADHPRRLHPRARHRDDRRIVDRRRALPAGPHRHRR